MQYKDVQSNFDVKMLLLRQNWCLFQAFFKRRWAHKYKSIQSFPITCSSVFTLSALKAIYELTEAELHPVTTVPSQWKTQCKLQQDWIALHCFLWAVLAKGILLQLSTPNLRNKSKIKTFSKPLDYFMICMIDC